MTSQSQIEANRANAQLSTGPKTPEGKAASSRNARAHGLTSKDLVILPREQDEFLDFQIELTGQIKPIGALERTAFDNLMHAAWNMRRIRRLEAQLAESGTAQRALPALPNESEPPESSSRAAAPFCASVKDPLTDPNLAAQCDRYARYFARAEKSYYRALRELRTLQSDRYALENANHPNEANFSPLVPIDKMAKRSQLATSATIDYTVAQFEAEAARFQLNSTRLQNEPKAAA